MYEAITLVGNLGGDPVSRFTPQGAQVTNFSLATNRSYTKNGERVKETVWWRVSAWGKTAEACQAYIKKGSKVLVECRMNADLTTGGPRIWTDNAGVSKASFEVTAQTVRFMDSKDDRPAAPQSKQAPEEEAFEF